ncbi:MAG: transposase [Rhizobiales bacterium]|nr:transposase [Hyphomicrobiales bacterium]
MARIARIIVPGLPHLVTQHGNFDAAIFWSDADYEHFLKLLRDEMKRNYVEVWAWSLLPGRFHLLVTPSDALGLGNAMAAITRQYASWVNRKAQRRGHLFGGRYSSIVIGEDNIEAAFRYVASAPVRAGLSNRPEDWQWSSVLANLGEEPDGITVSAPIRGRVPDLNAALAVDANDPVFEDIRKREGIGRPWGNAEFVKSWNNG